MEREGGGSSEGKLATDITEDLCGSLVKTFGRSGLYEVMVVIGRRLNPAEK